MHSHNTRNSQITSRIWLWGVKIFLGFGLLFSPAPALWAKSVSQSVDVVARIEPRLSLTITPETGEHIDFGTVESSQTEPHLSKPVSVALHVFSNLGKPYEVTQQLVVHLTNETGMTLSPDDLLVFPHDTPTSIAGQTYQSAERSKTLFSSDPHGQSMDRTISYQLRVPSGQAAGTYRGTLVMTVTAQ